MKTRDVICIANVTRSQLEEYLGTWCSIEIIIFD